MTEDKKARVVYTPRDTLQPYRVWRGQNIISFQPTKEKAEELKDELNRVK
jgi:hypothetical protein